SEPTSLAQLVASRAVFGRGAYGHSRFGTEDSLKRIARADVVQLHDTYYRPDNAMLVLAGDIEPAEALSLAKKAFGGWKHSSEALPSGRPGTGSSAAPELLVIDQPGAGQAGVVAAHAGIPRTSRDWYAGIVANAVLGGSYSARLNEEIRVKRGLSYGASSALEALGDGGLWLAAAQTKNPSAPEVVDLMLQQFAALASESTPAAELAARKATLIGAYGRSLETTSGLASRVAELALYDIDLAELGHYVDRVQAVTPAEVQTFAKAHLGAGGTHVVVVGDAREFDSALKQAHPHAGQIPAKQLDLDDPNLRQQARALEAGSARK
ncbi:MAG TPA: pitrilysin family protein, partial [Gammaproteobacteria bacterium]|nr:pitrilysin family protein [Gammaproteobacteria bacterium]